jgi:5'-methylthioadenosine phosphorylase
LTNLRKGIGTVKRILKSLLPSIPQKRDCACASALEYAIATDAKCIPEEKKKELGLFIGKYLAEEQDVSQA